MTSSIFLNGVYEDVLEEICKAQKTDSSFVCYLQPYSSSRIVDLAENPPIPSSPVTIYISTTSALSVVSYRALIVGWENKQKIDQVRLSELNEHISKHQPGETEIYMTLSEGKPCINLLSICALERLPTPIPVSSFIKTSNNRPLKPRTTSGGWVYVHNLPEWVGTIPRSAVIDNLNESFQIEVDASLELADSERAERLESAPKFPEIIQTIARSFKRNPDVVAAVLKRANGFCERCSNKAPFIRASKGTPYLEVHHRVMLSEGGEDSVENAMGLCPNCHRELHFGLTSS